MDSVLPKDVTSSRPLIAVVVPAFNEERSIARVLEGILALQSAHPELKIWPIIVNDGSRDRTADVLRELRKKFEFDWLDLSVNLGIGKAVQAGFIAARFRNAEVVLQVDGDGQHPVGEIPALAQVILDGKADIAVGSRYVEKGSGNVSSLQRQMGTLFFSWLIFRLTKLRVHDATSGFRAFSREALELLYRYYPDDYPEVQTYVSLGRCGFKLVELPSQMLRREHGKSSISPLKSIYYMIKVAIATVIESLRQMPQGAMKK